jgi:phenylalanyl-tRNA synthetase beta chain
MDIAIEDDLIEEVVRTKGYDWVPTTTLGGRLPAFEPQPMIALKEAVRDRMAAAGLDEVVTYSLTNQNLADDSRYGVAPVRLSNPMSSEMAELRLSLRDSLLRTLATNQRNVDGGVRLFEVGRVYQPRAEELPDEREVVAAVLSGPRGEPFWQAEAEPGEMDFFDAKGVLESLLGGLGVTATYAPVELPVLHPARTVQVSVDGKTIGFLGELHPRSRRAFDLMDRPVIYLEIDLSDLLGLLPGQSKIFSPIQKFPGLLRDLALVLDKSIPAERVIEIIRGAPLVQRVTLFDLYAGEQVPEGKKSLAFRLVYQSPGRTLTGEEADRNQERLLQRLQKELGATLRG